MYARAVHTVQVPGLAASDILIELQRLVLCQNTDRINTRIHTIGQGKINNPVFSP